MKKILILGIALSIGSGAMAQSATELSKEERKYWKKEARLYKKNPELLKDLAEAFEEAQVDVSVMEFEMDSLKVILEGYLSNIADNGRRMTKLEKQLAAQKELVAKMKLEAETKAVKYDKGVTFRVQIGAFRQRDLSEFFDNTENFHGETQKGVQKYTVGIFHDKAKAQAFRAQLVAIGIKDAWIVKYVDGQRVVDQGAVVADFE